jgi:hypothetical protein
LGVGRGGGGATVTGAGGVTGCAGTPAGGADGKGAVGAGVDATWCVTRRTRAGRAGRARSDARTRRLGAGPSATRGRAGSCRGGAGAEAVGELRWAAATRAKEIAKVAAAIAMAKSAGLSGRTELTRRGTS